MQDREIIELYNKRSQSAIRETADKYGTYLFTIAVNILHDAEDAAEVISDTYFRAWKSIPPAKPRELRFFLSRITRNLAIDRLRRDTAKRRSAQTVELLEEFEECLPDGENSVEDAVTAKELGGMLNAFLAALGTDDCGILLSRFYYMRTIDDIAAEYGLTARQIRYRLTRLRHELKEFLETRGVTL